MKGGENKMIEEAEVVQKSTSPLPPINPVVEKPKGMSFGIAMDKVTEGGKVTKLEWNDKRFYGYLSKTTFHLTLRRDDGKDYDWVISEGDLIGKDWVLVE